MSEQEHCLPSTINPSCLNSWDVQSKHIQPENGKAEALYSGECRGGGGESYVFCLEGNGQRESHKGDGYKESETMYTLNTVEQHGVCTYQNTTGALTPGAHPGSYNGQDAYNDMLVVGGVQSQSQQVKPHFF